MLIRTRNRQVPLFLAAAMLLAALTVAVLPAAPADAQEIGSPTVTVLTPALNVRSGPGTNYPVIGGLKLGASVQIVGRHSASGWWQVSFQGAKTGWVSGAASLVKVSGATDKTPEVTAPPAPARVASAPTAGKTIVFQESSGGAIYVIGSDGRGLRGLTTGMDPAISPDGRQVAFTRWSASGLGSTGSLWVINLDGSGERRISGDLRQPKSPTWSPDGKQIVVNQQHGGTLEPRVVPVFLYPPTTLVDIFNCPWTFDTEFGPVTRDVPCYRMLENPNWALRVINVADGTYRDLPSDIYAFAPTWNPANDWQVLYKGRSGLQSMDVKRDANWAVTKDASDRSPIYSPDGSRVALAYRQHDHLDIHVMNPDGSGRVRLTETPLSVALEAQRKGQTAHQWNNAAPAWSPDGRQIAFVTDRTGRWELWVMNADGSAQRPLFPAGALRGIELQYNQVEERVLSWR